ncbi:MAG: GNAT family N-acetyltransferase [Candidatus Diapherotrites archaeon]|nr:GNAT family N-acetyltransferase [Candidatus Diapherotrites archaeon]
MIIAEEDKENPELIGYLLLHKKDDDVWHIHTLNVLDSYRKKGIGSKLVEKAIQHVKNRKGNTILVQSDILAHGFWRKKGFEKKGKYYVLRL